MASIKIIRRFSLGQVITFVITFLLFCASVFPLFIMLKSSVQAMGDPLRGTPDRVEIARADRQNLTAQSRPMMAVRQISGVWEPDPAAWPFEPDSNAFVTTSPGAGFLVNWEGDLRRVHSIEVKGAGFSLPTTIVWKDVNEAVAEQVIEKPSGDSFVIFPPKQLLIQAPANQSGKPLDIARIAAFIIIPAVSYQGHQPISWSRIDIIPNRVTLANYSDVWQSDNFSRYTINSLVVSISITLGCVLTSLCVGYGFARGRLRGKSALWAVMLASMLIPSQVTLVPVFLILQHFPFFGGNNLLGQGGIGMLDSYYGLILPNLVAPLGILLVRQNLLSLPNSFEEAAVMDGASILQILFYVVAPLQRPILATVGLLTFLFSWNAFIYPLILIQSPAMRTLPVGLALYSAKNTVDWVHLMAAATITALPMFLVFALFQKQLISGLVQEGIKG